MQTTPSNVGVEKNFNTYAGIDGIDPDLPERLYELIESDAAPLIARCGHPAPQLDETERISLALFVATLMLRVPRGRRTLKEVDEALGTSMIRDAKPRDFREAMQQAGEEMTDEEAERKRRSMIESVKRGGVEVRAPQGRQIAFAFDIALDLTRHLNDMEWTVVRAPPTARFILSDCPVAMYDPQLPPGGANALWSSPRAETSVPLDPLFCLLLRPRAMAWTEEQVDAPRVHHINARTYAWGVRWVYGHQQPITDVRARVKRDRAMLADVQARDAEFRFRFAEDGLETRFGRRGSLD